MEIKIVKNKGLWNLLQINIVLEDVQRKKVALALHRSGQDVRQLVDSLAGEEFGSVLPSKKCNEGFDGILSRPYLLDFL